MLGGSEYVAEACQQTLEEFNHQATVHFSPNLTEIPIRDQTWLICTSTHGAGDYPDNIQNFVDQLKNSDLNLDQNSFFVIGIGDSSYDTFCYAAKNIRNLLILKGSKEKIELIKLDMSEDIDPESLASEWIKQHQDHL